jgi:hypothetical protein
MYRPSFPDAPTMHTFFAPGDPGVRTSPSTGRRWSRSLSAVIVSPLVTVLLLPDSAGAGAIGAPRSYTRSIATARYAPIDTEVLFGVLFGSVVVGSERGEARWVWLDGSLAGSP